MLPSRTYGLLFEEPVGLFFMPRNSSDDYKNRFFAGMGRQKDRQVP